MKCVCCNVCREHPEIPGRGIYGGPFNGYMDVSTPAGQQRYKAAARKAYRDAYGVNSDTYKKLFESS